MLRLGKIVTFAANFRNKKGTNKLKYKHITNCFRI